jgi:putative redox protein
MGHNNGNWQTCTVAILVLENFPEKPPDAFSNYLEKQPCIYQLSELISTGSVKCRIIWFYWIGTHMENSMKVQPQVIHTVTWNGDGRFIAENPSGVRAIIEKSPPPGSQGEYLNPMDFFITALGACPGVEITSICKEMNIDLQALRVSISSVRRAELPTLFESVHVFFAMTGDIDDRQIESIIRDVMTFRCPIAVSFGKLADLTWSFHIDKKPEI